MNRVLILGAGKIGAIMSGLLAGSSDYDIDLADVNGEAAQTVADSHGLDNVTAYELDAANCSTRSPCP